ncbi:hypothetical protein Anapl_02389 [Anas platyrhynchos]|uniref:Uncharacterized protein n=1 Tax=Anas platyrhynchos TaxID=8839 RepID=R0L9Q7_ANAPL|nr:hypothetical protein Anapl_02389 [Anas platyrhynchos]
MQKSQGQHTPIGICSGQLCRAPARCRNSRCTSTASKEDFNGVLQNQAEERKGTPIFEMGISLTLIQTLHVTSYIAGPGNRGISLPCSINAGASTQEQQCQAARAHEDCPFQQNHALMGGSSHSLPCLPAARQGVSKQCGRLSRCEQCFIGPKIEAAKQISAPVGAQTHYSYSIQQRLSEESHFAYVLNLTKRSLQHCSQSARSSLPPRQLQQGPRRGTSLDPQQHLAMAPLWINRHKPTQTTKPEAEGSSPQHPDNSTPHGKDTKRKKTPQNVNVAGRSKIAAAHATKQMFRLCRTCPLELLCFSASVLTASCSSTAAKTHRKYLLWRRCKINSEENKSEKANKPSGKPKGTESLYSTV